MRTAGDYALLHANGMPFSKLVELIRLEAIADFEVRRMTAENRRQEEASRGED